MKGNMDCHLGRSEIKMAGIPEVIRKLEQSEGKIKRMEKVINILYKISNEMHGFLNGYGPFKNGYFWSKGKIFDNEKDAYNFFDSNPRPIFLEYDEDGHSIGGWATGSGHKSEMVDCRFETVDIEMKQFIYNRICAHISKFYNESDNEDEFLLALGFSINLYYIVGLYSTFGKFDINRILESADSYEVKEYGNLINEFLYSRIVEGIVKNINLMKFKNVDLYNDTVDRVLGKDTDAGLDSMYRSVKEYDKNYVPDIYMAVKENDFDRKTADYYLDEMVNRYPDFRFGLVYCCIQKGLRFYETKGKDIGVLELKDKLGNDLFLHILGMNELEYGKFEADNGEIKTVRPALFSQFGIGIPKIKTITDDEFCRNINTEILVDDEKRKEVSFTDIRKQTESILGINVYAHIDDSPLKYTGKLFEIVEQQKKKLELKNKELLRLNEQRRTLMDHLAHSWGNECYPEIVKRVAEELLKNGENSLANKLFKAYNSENNLMGEIIFLQVAMEDKPGKLKEIFYDSFFISGKGKKEWKIQTVVEEALENLVFSLLNYTGSKKKTNICQNKLRVKHSLEELAEDYSKRFETDENLRTESFVEWFSNNIFPVIINVDECWNKINFGNTEYGKIVMKNIFTELFTNVLFHGEKMCRIEFVSTDDKMYIKMKNNVAQEISGQQKGLGSLKEIIAKLNYNTVVSEDEELCYGMKDEKTYETVIVFAKELMFIDEEW